MPPVSPEKSLTAETSVWLNGEVLPSDQARINVEDRGFQFADGIYEVIRIYNGRAFALDQHLARLEKSAAGIQLAVPLNSQSLKSEINKYLARFTMPEGMIYLQVTRGVAPRNHRFPEVRPTLLFYTRPLVPMESQPSAAGVKVHALHDERWQRCWIKSIALLPNVLAKNEAIAAGAEEAVFIDNELVTECSASNIFAVVGGRLMTHPVGPKVLPGITRAMLLELAPTLGISASEQPFRAAQAAAADELFITSTIREVAWVSHWNDRPVGAGQCGPVTRKLFDAMRELVKKQTM